MRREQIPTISSNPTTVVLAQLEGGRSLPVCGAAAGLCTTTVLAFSPDGIARAVGGMMVVVDLRTKD